MMLVLDIERGILCSCGVFSLAERKIEVIR